MTRESLKRKTYVVVKRMKYSQVSDMKNGKKGIGLGYVLEGKSIRVPRENEKTSQGLFFDISVLDQWL